MTGDDALRLTTYLGIAFLVIGLGLAFAPSVRNATGSFLEISIVGMLLVIIGVTTFPVRFG